MVYRNNLVKSSFRMVFLLAPLVDLLEEDLKDLLLKSLGLINLVDLRPQIRNTLLLPLLIELRKLKLMVQGLDLGFRLRVLNAVVLVKDLALLWVHFLESLVDQP